MLIYLLVGALIALVMHSSIDLGELQSVLRAGHMELPVSKIKILVWILSISTIFIWPAMLALIIAMKVVR